MTAGEDHTILTATQLIKKYM